MHITRVAEALAPSAELGVISSRGGVQDTRMMSSLMGVTVRIRLKRTVMIMMAGPGGCKLARTCLTGRSPRRPGAKDGQVGTQVW